MKKIIIPIILSLYLTSCSDFLEKEPVEQISIKDQFSTKEGVLKALNGVYYNTRSSIFTISTYTYGDLLSGNLTFSPSRSTGNISIPSAVDLLYNFTDDSNSSNLKQSYINNYQIINNINLIIENIDEAKDINEEEKNAVLAEAYALRAFVHYQLLRFYAQNYTYTSDASHPGVVYNTRTLIVGIDYPARNTVSECYTLLESDLNKALSLYQNYNAIPVGSTKNFMNKNAAKTLSAIIALDKENYAKAISLSTDIIDNSGIQLAETSDYVQNFAVNESIFEIANTNENESYVKNFYSPKTGYSNYVISDYVVQLFDNNDQRLNFIKTTDIQTVQGVSKVPKNYYFTKKYDTSITGLVYRLTELYFIRAEAAFKSGNINMALADINTIRNRAGLNDLAIISLDDILTEKRKEFVFENKYFFDLMRNHRGIVRESGCISSICSLSYPNNKFIAPIPLEAIQINSYLQQNSGY